MQHSQQQQSHQQHQSAPSSEKNKKRLKRLAQNVGITLFLLLIQVVMYRGVMPSANLDDDNAPILSTASSNDADEDEEDATSFQKQHQPMKSLTYVLPIGFQAILTRAQNQRDFCYKQVNHSVAAKANSFLFNNTISAKLPAYGIVKALTSWKPVQPHQWSCQLPPETECQETQVTAILMAHKPEKLNLMVFNIQQQIIEPPWKALIKEIILVYNGPRDVLAKHKLGLRLAWLAKQNPERFRIFYALEQPGFGNHLMNRYHPTLNVTTKGILFYDDDGPFYTHAVTLAAFELWKRNANVQVGALGRMLDLSPRQSLERNLQRQQGRLTQYDKMFVSHCQESGDQVDYNYKLFPNFGSHMVLPSSSFLHVNYLCFLWHPALMELRKFITSHPVFPDDMAVSFLVSQLSGRAPRTYPRFLEKGKTKSGEKATASNPGPVAAQQQEYHQAKSNVSNLVAPNNKSLPSKGDKDSKAQHSGRQPTSKKADKDTTNANQSGKQPISTKTIDKAMKTTEMDQQSKPSSTGTLKQSMKKQEPQLSKPNASQSSKQLRRRLLDWQDEMKDWEEFKDEDSTSQFDPDRQRRRRLLWADVPKEVWAARRSNAANSLVAYFGSVNAGGIGWCTGTPYQKGTDKCVPELAEVGMLPWMNEDNTPKSTCP